MSRKDTRQLAQIALSVCAIIAVALALLVWLRSHGWATAPVALPKPTVDSMSSVVPNSSTHITHHHEPECVKPKYDPEIDGPAPRHVVVGQFVADKVDTLILEPTSSEPDTYFDHSDGPIWEWWNWHVHSVKGTVADIKLDITLCPQFCNTGDLDGNGTDELCIYRRNYSNFTCYYIITYRDGAWHVMTEHSIFVHEGYLDEDIDITSYVAKSDKPGYIRALACRDVYGIDDGDWLGYEVVPDSLIKLVDDGCIYGD